LNLAGIGSNSQGNDQPTRLLVVGAGVAGQTLVKEIQEHKLPVEPVAFLDDDPRLTGTTVCGLPVHGTTDDLVEVAARVQAQEVLLAIPSSGGALVRRLVILCKRAKLPFKIVPGLRDIILGDVHFSQVSEVKPEHLLGRETVDFRAAVARELVAGRTVMVTGAGGSIGGELCRQVMSLVPKKLIMLGRGENSIFEMAGELAGLNRGTEVVQVIADVRDQQRLSVLAGRLQPQLILHAAAHKHVPLMEENPEEAVLVNVGGTANMVEFARQVGAERFVLISTDKAVSPTSVMGASKKMAEMVVRRAADKGKDPRFITVRFGNVLGSRGSVVPFFQKRIQAGLPLPITDPEMTRYFMTIKEAALLVIEAMVMGEQGATYILEMGNPVSILELARNLLALSGYDPVGGDEGPGIDFTGLRPGEKLHEALNEDYENLTPSDHPLIMKAEAANGTSDRAMAVLDQLLEFARQGDIPSMRDMMAGLLSQPALAASQVDEGKTGGQ
jgi:FlaA1/EpsC-like NDP-sugar epimerase